MAPKIPSSSRENKTEDNLLASSTQAQTKHPSSVNGECAPDDEDIDAEKLTSTLSSKQKNFVNVVTAPPRTSQLERRKRVMKVDTAKVVTSAGDSSIDRNHVGEEFSSGKRPSFNNLNNTSYVGSFGFGSREDFGVGNRGIVSAGGAEGDGGGLSVNILGVTQSSFLGVERVLAT